MSSVILFLIAGLGAALLLANWRPQDSWLPPELRGGKMVGIEKSLSTVTPFRVTGRLDRVYRLANGEHAPLEYKNRDTIRLFEKDRAQLSLQAWLLRKNGKPTAPHGYLVVRVRSTGKKCAVKVDLGDDAYCEHLIQRYLAVRDGRVKPAKAGDGRCKNCGHRDNC